jgi:hypothetical protein
MTLVLFVIQLTFLILEKGDVKDVQDLLEVL